MYLTVKAFSQDSFDKFHKLVSNGDNLKQSGPQYDQLIYKGVQITFYNNLTILFKGNINEDLEELIDVLIDKELYVGSDEVGVGEGVGPMVAAAIKFNDYESKKRVILHGIKDSKKMNHNEIMVAAKVIKNNAEVQLISLDPVKFNSTYKKIPNVKKINAIMQNKILSKFDGIKVTDEFVNLNKFKEYLSTANEEMFEGTFILEQKAEDKYMEVAAAAIVAKAYYNEWMINHCKENNIPLEVGDKVKAQDLYLKIRSGEVKVSNPELLMKDWTK